MTAKKALIGIARFSVAPLIIILAFILIILMGIFFTLALGEELNRAEFSGIRFKSRYQKVVEIRTPIKVEMDNETRRLSFTLKDPFSAKIKFLAKITPEDFKIFYNLRKFDVDLYLFWIYKAYLLPPGSSGSETLIDTLTINIDKGPNKWLDDYKNIIEENFKNCSAAPAPNGHPDMVCPPLWIEARITKIERSILNPNLPSNYIFPNLDYMDIYIEILNIRRWQP